ncbi:hypothetical protein LEM8419_03379 [Neolewinella maritima]|uniref:Uncharacterized protein n=1 Tax=Neolewinella maritima TaxID=1383882 RepID=A0ABN8FDU5_9BACT|nr:hypothetical protein [Neolewinella maritima]CAH1002500.1 hypothetical protein LEM8419_03379 [Neolewinella maritima]
MTPATQLDGIELKLRQLTAKVDRQRAQYQAAMTENERLQQQLDRQEAVVTSLRDKLAQATSTSAAPAASSSPAPDLSEQRQTVAYCLQEIDRCLDWLHRN